MGSFKFPFQDKAVMFTCANASRAEALCLGGCFRRQAANTGKFWGMCSPEKSAWQCSPGSTSQTHLSFTLHGKGGGSQKQ